MSYPAPVIRTTNRPHHTQARAEHVPANRPSSRPLRVPLLCLASALVLVAGCDKSTTPTAASKAAADSKPVAGAPTLELFVMSQCPYGVEAVNAAIAAREQLGGALDVKLQFIGDGVPGALESMHGPNEITGDLAQVCAAKVAPDRVLKMVACQNEDPRSVHTNWQSCAKDAGIDGDALQACIVGDEGQKLLAASFAEAKRRQISGSPTMFLDGSPYEGGRRPRDLVRAACGAFKGDKPQSCTSIPEPAVVHAVFLSDARCKECDIGPLEPKLKGLVNGLTVEHVDYQSERGKALYGELTGASKDFKLLPAVLFEADIEKDTDAYKEIQRYLKPVSKYRELAIGGEWDPTAEICDNGTDDDGDGAADCADDGCSKVLVCREAKPQTLDLFVMSQCPYGAKAMVAAKRFVDHFGKDATLAVHFIGDERAGELMSMHGPNEVAEDLRERCAVEKYPKDHQFMKYLACRSLDYKSTSWEGCATSSGMDPKVIQACVDGEGKKLLGADFAMAKDMKIGSSPTFISNNRRDFNAIEASEIQREFCKDNAELAACKDLIPADPAAAAAGPQPGGQCN